MKVFCLLLLLLIGATCVIAESHTDPLDKSPTDSTPPPSSPGEQAGGGDGTPPTPG